MTIKFLSAIVIVVMSSTFSQADVVINEIMRNPTAVSDFNGEWFELFNTGSTDIDIEGWTIRDDGSDSHVINNDGSLVVGAGDYLVLGINADSISNGGLDVDYEYQDVTLGNGTDEIVLLDLSLTEIDRVNYSDSSFPNDDPLNGTGRSLALFSPSLDNNIGSNWYAESGARFGDGDAGTPGARNFLAVPEPSSAAICSMVLIGIVSRRRRTRNVECAS